MEYGGNEKKDLKMQIWLYALDLLDMALVTVPFAVCWYLYYAGSINAPFFNKGNWLVVAMFTVLYVMFCKLYSGFNISVLRMSEIIYSQSLSLLIADVFMYFVISLLSKGFVFIPYMLLMLTMQILLSALWAILARNIYFRISKPLRTVIIWDMREGFEDLVSSYKLDRRFRIVRTMHIDDCTGDPRGALREADAVFLCGIHSTARNQIVKYCISAGMTAYVIPRIGDVIMSSAVPIHMFHLPMMVVGRYSPSLEYLVLKRLFDIIISATALIILSPLMLVTALIVKSDGGTVFYRQKRLTKNRKEFDIIKFRSMRMDAEKDGVARLSGGSGDSRVTKAGVWLRRFRIDELPQLFCCLSGSLSLVGPRPERPEIAEQYEKEMPEFALRLQAKAGITGLAQVCGKYNTSPYDKLLMDLQYIAKPGLFEDVKILFATIKIIFMPESTEGVAKGQITAAVSKSLRDVPEEPAAEEERADET